MGAALAGEGEAALRGDACTPAGVPGRGRPRGSVERSCSVAGSRAPWSTWSGRSLSAGFLFGAVGARRAPLGQALLFSLISEMLTRWKGGTPVPSHPSHLGVARRLGDSPVSLSVPFRVVLETDVEVCRFSNSLPVCQSQCETKYFSHQMAQNLTGVAWDTLPVDWHCTSLSQLRQDRSPSLCPRSPRDPASAGSPRPACPGGGRGRFAGL